MKNKIENKNIQATVNQHFSLFSVVLLQKINTKEEKRLFLRTKMAKHNMQLPANRDDLKMKLAVTLGGIVFTTIQYFLPEIEVDKQIQLVYNDLEINYYPSSVYTYVIGENTLKSKT